ncbi:four helix bundle protein [Neorhodopirellula pilleata]|nr:four helix bundle protein [Neorhodopirellula pilleata]
MVVVYFLYATGAVVMFGFEKLDVWSKSMDLADVVYRLTKDFPDYERFGLANQMRRAAVSVSSNIAEGSSRESKKDFARFIQLAFGSLMEIVSQLHIAQRQGFIPKDEANKLYAQSKEISKMLSGLKRSLEQ